MPPPNTHDPDALFAAAVRAHQAGDLATAARLYGDAITLRPAFADALNNLGIALRGLGHLDAAADAYDRAVAAGPGYAEAYQNLGIVRREQGRLDDAVASFLRAIELKPDYAKAYSNLGVALQELGRADEAVQAFDVALILTPNAAHAWHAKSELKRFTAGDPDIAKMRAALDVASTPDDRILLEFALAKALMDSGDADQAFDHYAAANGEKRETFDYDLYADLIAMEEIATVFSPQLMRGFAGGGHSSARPVFVVGMPRSGTTLAEQILASHPLARGAGELGQLQGVIEAALGADGYPARAPFLTADDLAALGAAYVGATNDLAHGVARLVDKMPGNIRYAGLIHLMLPNARIIHCRRDPMDVGLSCWTKLFTGHQPFAYDLEELGLYQLGEQQLAEHWGRFLPTDRYTEVVYETLVGDLETEARRLVAFCGLEWDDACLDFHQTQRAVRTASAQQVRQPLYTSSIGRWRAYAAHLKPLADALAQ